MDGYIRGMNAIAISTLRYVKRLKAVGFTEEQAEVQAKALSEAVRESLVTKDDLREAVTELCIEIRELYTNLLKWLIIGQTAVVAALVKLL